MTTPRQAPRARRASATDLEKTRHAFYENDEKVTLEIFDKGVDASKVEIVFKPRSVSRPPPMLRLI